MLRHLTTAVVATALSLTLPADRAPAQLRFAVGGGVSFPLGRIADAYDTGWRLQGSTAVAAPFLPIALRVDAAYDRFPGNATADAADYRVVSGTVNAVFTVPSVVITPYVLGGLGLYYTDVPSTEREGSLGANVGAGVRLGLPLFSIFVEARLHNIFVGDEDARFAPVIAGVQF